MFKVSNFHIPIYVSLEAIFSFKIFVSLSVKMNIIILAIESSGDGHKFPLPHVSTVENKSVVYFQEGNLWKRVFSFSLYLHSFHSGKGDDLSNW